MTTEAWVMRPITVTPAMLWYYSVTETDYVEYSAATTYAAADIVQVAASHSVYYSLVAGNTGNAVTDTTKWLYVGPTRYWAMFDDSVGSYTTSDDGTIYLVAHPDEPFTAVALFDVTATAVRVEVYDLLTGGTLYDQTQYIADQTISDWDEYYSAPFVASGDVIFTDIGLAASTQLRITIVGDGTVAVGKLAFGPVSSLGSATYGVSMRLINRGRVTTTALSLSYLVPRRSTRTVNAVLKIESTRLNAVVGVLEALDNVPSVWWLTPITGYESLAVFGYHRDTRVSLPNPAQHDVNIQVETLA